MNKKDNNENQIFLNMQKQDFSVLYVAIGVIHIVYTLIFEYMDVVFMSNYNIFSSLFYLALGIVVSKLGHMLLCFVLCFIEIVCFSSIGTIYIGYDAGFPLYFVALIPLAMYLLYLMDTNKKMFYKYLSAGATIYFSSIFVSMTDILPKAEMYSPYKKFIFLMNTVVSFLVLIFFFYVFLFQIEHNEDSLRKENEALKNVANYDPLTKLLNRRTFDFYFEKHLKNVQNKGKDFCILLADIDDFKVVNDTYGHDVGDNVLCEIANIFKEQTKGKGQSFRWGGEELLCILSLSEKDAVEFAEKLCQCIREYSFNHGHITISVGISVYRQMETEDSMVKKADNALYFGKKHGKDQVNVYGKCRYK